MNPGWAAGARLAAGAAVASGCSSVRVFGLGVCSWRGRGTPRRGWHYLRRRRMAAGALFYVVRGGVCGSRVVQNMARRARRVCVWRGTQRTARAFLRRNDAGVHDAERRRRDAGRRPRTRGPGDAAWRQQQWPRAHAHAARTHEMR